MPNLTELAVDVYDWACDVANEGYIRFERGFSRIWKDVLSITDNNEQPEERHD